MRQIWRITALAALLCAILAAGARAADTSYSGRIDPETGEALDEAKPLDGSTNSGRAYIGGDAYYDFNEHCFVYLLSGNTGEVLTDAADGMVLSGATVALRATQDAPVTFFRNGEALPAGTTAVSDVGEYTVVSQAEGRSRQLIKFSLVGAYTNSLNNFVAPDGFYITEATRDGEDVTMDRYNVNMEVEGQYHIVYSCVATGSDYVLETTIDRTPPQITLKGMFDKDMRARSEVSFEGLEPGDTIWVTNNGETVTPALNDDRTGGTLYDMGNYTLTVYDAADNSSTYEFTIMTYFNVTSLMFFALVVMCVSAVFLYVRFKSKRLKIG